MASTDVRDRILAATLHIIGTDGVPGVTNRRIARQAGVSLGSITYHFPSQSDLLRAALSGFVSDETGRLLALADGYRDSGLGLEDVAALTEQIAKDLAFSAERIAPFELYIQAGRDHTLRDAAAECFAAYDELTVTILTALGIPDAGSIAPTLVATIAGLQLRRWATGAENHDISASMLLLLHGAAAPH